MRKVIDETGNRYGRLSVISKVGNNKKVLWKCKCECGQLVYVKGSNLRSGDTMSCGCLKKEISRKSAKKASKARITHNKTKTSEYAAWAHMLQRCTNKKDKSYYNYGGRGIEVCKQWFSFENFIEDMGMKPSKDHTLERINNNKGYYPENCKWATKKEQTRNKRIDKKNTTGAAGVSWDRQRKKHVAGITVNRKTIFLGRFDLLKDAIEARRLGEIKHWRKNL